MRGDRAPRRSGAECFLDPVTSATILEKSLKILTLPLKTTRPLLPRKR